MRTAYPISRRSIPSAPLATKTGVEQPLPEVIVNTSSQREVAPESQGSEADETQAQELQPDLIFIDIGLSKQNGIEAGRQISRIVPTATILFVSQINDEDAVEEALSNGGKGYVWKQEQRIDLEPAIEAVLRGSRFVSTGVAKSHPPSRGASR